MEENYLWLNFVPEVERKHTGTSFLLSGLLLLARLDKQSRGAYSKIDGNWKWNRAVKMWEYMMKCLTQS